MSQQRCSITELLTDQCAHCRPAPATDPVELLLAPKLGPWFEARYDGGECANCGWRFSVGDQIRADGDGGWFCVDCGQLS